MPNTLHLKVLLKKDFLTLKRNVGFLIAFVVLPVGLMSAFIAIQNLVDKGDGGGTLLNDHFKYTTNKYTEDYAEYTNLYSAATVFMDKTLVSTTGKQRVDLSECLGESKGKYFFNRYAIITDIPTVGANAKTFFEEYVFGMQFYNDPENIYNNGTVQDWQVEVFETEDDVFEKVKTVQQQPYCMAIKITKFDTTKHDYEFQFSLLKPQVPDTNLASYNDLVLTPDFTSYDLWFKGGAVQLYPLMNEFIARANDATPDFASLKPVFPHSMGYAPMKSAEFINISAIGAQQLSQNFPFFFMIIFLIPFYYLTTKIASEKESKAREGMKMMGLNDGTYFLSWYILFFVIVLFQSVVIAIIAQIGIFKKVNFIIFLIFCIMYSSTLFGQSFLIVSFLPRSSGIAATLFHFVTYYLSFILQDPLTPSSLQYGLSVFPNVCMNQCIKQIFFYNFNTLDGLNFSSMGVVYQGYSFTGGLLMLLFNLVFWTSLGLYCDQVVPTQFGVAKPWNFCCKRTRRSQAGDQENQALLSDDDVGTKNTKNFEKVPDSIKKQEQTNDCLRVRGLVKKFGDKTAVNGTSMTMYNGQIFALLGHNGAGKTTTLSMLTGLLEPTAGQASVFGIDIFQNMDDMRKILGVCPQHDVLFDFLTCEDHLRLFASFKGTPSDQIEGQVKQMLEEIDLTDVKHLLSKKLSGGQKRKLSVAIAMIGNSKIVMLDEPTSGMDTAARRRLWEMLKKNKQGRIVILTTHYMDEADILGDRIAIMAEGDVQCTGSSLFLKNRYGVGYNLVISKQNRKNAPQIDKFVLGNIQGALKMQEVSSEITYQLPTESSKQFKEFFKQFDENLDSLGIRSYGVGITTLEEVFLKIGHGEEVEKEKFERIQKQAAHVQSIDNTKDRLTEDDELETYTISDDAETNVFFLHFWYIMKKRFLMQIRDKKTLTIDTIFPIILILAGLALATISIFKDGVPREMSPYIYPEESLQQFYNLNSALIDDDGTIEKIMNDWVKPTNDSVWKIKDGVPINIDTSNPPLSNADISGQLEQFDDHIYTYAKANNLTSYGQIYINSLNSEESITLGQFYSAVVLVNSTSQSSPGAWGSFAHTLLLKQYFTDQKIEFDPTFQVKYTDYPFPVSKTEQAIVSVAAGTTSAFLMTIAFMMISDALLQNTIKERQKNIKHQIMISGSSLSAYWLGNYAADIVFQLIPATFAVVGIHVFSLDLPQVEYLFLVVIFANPAFVYFFSFLFDKDDSGSLAIKMLYFLLGIIAPITVSILQVLPNTVDTANILRWFFYPFPAYSLTFGYISIANRQIIQIVDGLSEAPDVYSNKVAGPSMIFLLVSIPFYWILVIMFEFKVFDILFCKRGVGANGRQSLIKSFGMQQEDQDIADERTRVIQKLPEELQVRCDQIKKKYGKVEAVKNISFGLEHGECFALLGISGAGKTSLFKCMTGEVYPTKGQLTINGNDITTSSGFQKARKQIGYCPQFDAIFEGLTVYEHLQIYAALKGIRTDLRERLIQKQIREMDLESYTNVRANNLSGGNKRKMSVAMAMIGNPPLVFLDEPSTGVDPQAKRFMWNIVSKISTQRKNSAVIITTHSMEEAEALCTKMGIMVAGEFKCFGSSQHIKDKYGTGYELEVKIKTIEEQEVEQALMKILEKRDNSSITREQCEKILQSGGNLDLLDEIDPNGLGSEFDLQLKNQQKVSGIEFYRWQFVEGKGKEIIEHLQSLFKSFEILEHYGNSWKLRVSRDNYSIGYLFGLMEDIQVQFEISEYSVAQTTLEQIFNNFAMEHEQAQGRGRKKNVRRSTLRDSSTKKK